jgi:hypothetical protein
MSTSIGRSAFHNPQRYSGRLGDSINRLQFGALTGQYTIVSVTDGAKNVTTLPGSAQLVYDWGALELGLVRFSPPPYAEHFVYYGQSLEMPADTTGFQDAIRVPVLVQKLGLMSQMVPSILVINALKALYDSFGYQTKAQEELLAVYAQRSPRRVTMASRPGDVFYAPVLEIVDWMERDSNVFGPRRVRAPLPILPPGGAAPLQVADTTNQSPPPAAALPAVPKPTPPPLQSIPATAAPVPAAEDPPFDGGTPISAPSDGTYRPVGTGRRASTF